MTFLKGAKRFLIVSGLAYILLKALFLSGLATEYVQQVVLYSLVMIIASLGLNVIYGYTGQFSLGPRRFLRHRRLYVRLSDPRLRRRLCVRVPAHPVSRRSLFRPHRLPDRGPHIEASG